MYSKQKRFTRRKFSKGNALVKGAQNMSSLWRMAKDAYSMAKYIKSIVNVEYKFIDDIVLTTASLTTTGSIYYLSGIGQGDTSSQRNGNSVKAKSISVKIQAITGGYITTQRYILFIDRNNNSQTPTVADLLVTDSVLGRYNDDNAGSRFKILDDKRVSLGFNDTTNHYASGLPNKDLSFYHNLNHHLKYDGTTSNISDGVSGHLFLYTVASNSGGSTTTVTSRLTYIDN